MTSRLGRDFFNRPTLDVAQALLGKELVFHQHRGIITETEAYIGKDDPACHAARGKTPRNAPMFGSAGYSYVYLIYGMYHCLNFVTEEDGFPAAVLIRGVVLGDGRVSPSALVGEAVRLSAKVRKPKQKQEQPIKHLDGPGKLCRAFGITREHTSLDITTHPEFYVQETGLKPLFDATPRIGISQGKDLLWRFVVKG